MPDVCDLTDIRMEKEDELRRRVRSLPHKVSIECLECGEYISPERQKATDGTSLCVTCSADNERRLLLFRR